MNVVQQTSKLPILNLDRMCVNKNESTVATLKHGHLLPNSIRGIICGPSNSGKSNVMLSLLFNENGLKFENVYIYSKSLYQPKYKLLEQVLTSLRGIVGYFPCNENADIVKPVNAQPNSIMIFDDVAIDKQDMIREYFSMGRHNAIDCFYLCQSFSKIPKQLIRDNANLIILFKQDDLNLKHVYQDHVGVDMSFEKFKQICFECWEYDKYAFLTIAKEFDISNGRYRMCFDKYIEIT